MTESDGELESDSELDSASNDEDVEGVDEGDLNASSTQKVLLDKADRSLSELHRWYNSGRISLDPEWQRNYVWDRVRASKLIESFLMDIPVPVIYLAKSEDGKYEVIDGLQRLSAVFEFFANSYKLQRLDMRTDLIGMTFRDLPERDQRKLEDAILRSFELSSGQGDMHFMVFERLNTGGVRLNDMEIRNCLFRGPLNSLIKDLATNPDLRRCLNQKGVEKRMQDRALTLRFLAFYERTHHKCQHGLKRFLNEFLETYRNATADKIVEYRKVFEGA